MISVCMATFNGSGFLEEQIGTILEQLSSDDELIISDDGSTDNTISIIKLFNDNRIKFYFNEDERGYSTNFCNALSKASGDIIFLADQDDVWLPGKVNRCLHELNHCDFVVHDAKIVDVNLNELHCSYFKFRGVKKGFFASLYKIGYLGCCMAFKRELLIKLSPMPLKAKVITHDSWLTLASELYFKVVLIHEPLLLYRRHGSNVSNGGASESNSLWFKFYIRFYSLLNLIKYSRKP